MARFISRRRLLQSGLATGAALGLGEMGFLSKLGPVSADEATFDTSAVRLDDSIAATVRLIEETPRERLLEEVAARIRGGLSYREILAALLLAGVKNIEPRPEVGFKFHAVLVVNSAHLASLSSPAEHRWLPIFWALDYYKEAAARDVSERNDWKMKPVDEAALPAAHQASEMFAQAMENWDESAADVSIAALARTAGSNEIYERLFRLGCRDFRSIGHKAIYVANSYRTLQCIGWQNAEPVFRSLVYAMLMHEEGNPAQRDAEADRPFRRNQELATKIRSEWRGGREDKAATETLLQTLRTGSNDEVCDLVVKLLNDGISPTSIWDGLHVASGELLMRQPGIVSLHTVTTTNALRFAFQTSADDLTRRLLLLQNAAFLPMFRQAMESRGSMADLTIARLEQAPHDGPEPPKVSLEQIFAEVGQNDLAAAQSTIAYLRQNEPQPQQVRQMMDMARLLVFIKGDNAHDYKFSSALFEDYGNVSPAWRDIYLASNVCKLRGTTSRDNPLVERTRAALKG